MKFSIDRLPYKQTGYFSKLILDYLDETPDLKPFYTHAVSVESFENAIAARSNDKVDRALLVDQLKIQYENLASTPETRVNINALLDKNTFTICTAHQPAIFTGSLYFIYKIIHVIKLTHFLKKAYPAYNFVPVFWMGSEDADLEELGKCFLNGEKIVWDTNQKGAVGRMSTKGLDTLVQRISGELSVDPFGAELTTILKNAYTDESNVQTAMFHLLHALFDRWGLITLMPDNPSLKGVMKQVFVDELFKQPTVTLVNDSIELLSSKYKAQANPRLINLFYLKDNLRERIEKISDNEWHVLNTDIRFNQESLIREVNQHPERFSPNVMLRGLYQEMILPNLAYIGGGGETAYWLQLKSLFEFHQVPFPMLVLRNSFLWISNKLSAKMNQLDLSSEALFKSNDQLLQDKISHSNTDLLSLSEEVLHFQKLMQEVASKASKIDATLMPHAHALSAGFEKRLKELEKKMLKAEKRKFNDFNNAVLSLKKELFPLNGLQERIDNFMPYFAKYGPSFFDSIYEASPTLDGAFTIIKL